MSALRDAIDQIVPVVEATGAAVVLGGIALAVFRVLRVPFIESPPPLVAVQIRLGLGLSLALGLEFLLAADILRTAVSPTFSEIGQLAAIAAIRTGLNFFLGRELVEGRRQLEALSAARLNHGTVGPPHVRPVKSSEPRGVDASGVARSSARDAGHRSSPDRRRIGAAIRTALAGPRWLFEAEEEDETRAAPE